MAKIVVLCPECPHPIKKGSHSRMDAMIRSVSMLGHDVYLCVLKIARDHRTSAETEADLKSVYSAARVVVVNHPHYFSKRNSYDRRVRDYILQRRMNSIRETISNRHTCPARFRKAVEDLFHQVDPDVVLVNYAKLANAVPSRFSGLRVVDTHDVQHLLQTSIAGNANSLEFSLSAMKSCERSILSRFDRIIAINQNEHDYLKYFLYPFRKPIYTIPAFNVADTERCSISEFQYDFLFVGSSAIFNRDGFMKFEKEVLSRLSKRHPNIKAAVVGSVCDTMAVKKLNKKYIARLGYVEDLTEVYNKARVVVVPIMTGAGMKIKLVEALAHGKAIVSTSKGADGVAIENGTSGFVTDDWEQFSEYCENLLINNSLRENIELGAAKLYRDRHHVTSTLGIISQALSCDFYQERITEAAAIHQIEKHPLGLIFTPDARNLVDINLALARALRGAGSRIQFLKFSKTGYSIFHHNGFDVKSINDYNRRSYRARAQAALKNSDLEILADKRVLYRGFDLTEDIEFHRTAFPNHFKTFKNSVLHTVSLLMIVEDTIAHLRPDFLVGWNGNGPHLMYIIKVAGAMHRLPVIHSERGLLPDTFVADAKGVNFKGALAGSNLPIISAQDAKTTEQKITKYRNSKQTIVEQGIAGGKSEVLSSLGIADEDGYILFPQQIETDSNIIVNSPQYKTMDSVLSDVCVAARSLDLTVVVRPHPENKSLDDRTSADLTEKYGCSVIICSDIHVHSLIEHSKCVVTINSTVGLEALLFNKPVIALGNAIYSFKGMTFDSRNGRDIEDAILTVMQGRDDPQGRWNRVIRFRAMLDNYLFDLRDNENAERNISRAKRLLQHTGIHVSKNINKTMETARSLKHWDEFQIIEADPARKRFGIVFLLDGATRYLTGSQKPEISIETLGAEAPNLVANATFVSTSAQLRHGQGADTALVYCNERSYSKMKYKYMLNNFQRLIFIDEFFEPFAFLES